MQKTRLVVVYRVIDKDDKVISEFQHKILDEQEHHPFHSHKNHLPATKSSVEDKVVEANVVYNPPPAEAIEVATTIELFVVLDLKEANYAGSDFMARVCAHANEGFNGKPWVANDGGWYKSDTPKMLVPIQDNKKYFVRLACANIPINANASILENDVLAEDWTLETICNGQLNVYTKCFDGVDSLPVVTLKN